MVHLRLNQKPIKMHLHHLKVTLPAMAASVGADQLSQIVPEPDGNLVNMIVQVIIGILTIVGFFKKRKQG